MKPLSFLLGYDTIFLGWLQLHTGTRCLHAFVIGVSNKDTWLYTHILVLVQIWTTKVRIYWLLIGSEEHARALYWL
jgi:hypothetical protein